MLDNHIEDETKRKGEIVKKFLLEEIQPLDKRLEIRGIGLLWGIDFNRFPDPSISARMVSACFQNGLIAERAGRGNHVLKIMPPLVIEDEYLYEGLEILKKSLQAVLPKE